MTLFRSDVDDFREAAADLSRIAAKAVPQARVTMGQLGEAFADEWRANARETSGEHGKHYPDSIDAGLAFTVSSVAVDVGPNRLKKQGAMGRGFEFGSENQPPHLDGLRAMTLMEPRITRALDATIGGLFDGAAG